MKNFEIEQFIHGETDGAFKFKVNSTFVLLYFQHLNYKNVSVLVDAKNLTQEKFNFLTKKISEIFQNENNLLMLKMYGNSDCLKIINSFLRLKIYASIKDIDCQENQEIHFFPSLNKIKIKDISLNLKIYDSEMDGSFKFLLSKNQFFISFHHKSFKNFAAVIDIESFDLIIFESLIKFKKNYFKDDDYMIKLLANDLVLTKLKSYLFAQFSIETKYVSIQEKDEIQYYPSLNRVRLFKSESKELVKISINDLNIDRLVVIGGSTGAPNVLKQLLSDFPKKHCPILIVQHYPSDQLVNLGNNIKSYSGTNVSNVQDSVKIVNNTIYLPANHLNMVLSGQSDLFVAPENSGAINNYFPSIDLLFFSVSRLKGKKVLAIILTGMGNDGAKGMEELKKNGALTYGQNQESSVVFGMPNEANKLKALNKLCSIEELKTILIDFSQIK